MKINITTAVTHKGKFHPKGIANVDPAVAKELIAGNFAEEHKEDGGFKQQPIQQHPVPSPDELSKRFEGASKKAMGDALAEARKITDQSPFYDTAQAMIKYLEAALKQ